MASHPRWLDGYHNGFGSRLIAFICHIPNGNQDIRLRKIGGGDAGRNFIRSYFEALRPPRFGLEMADKIHPLIFFERQAAHVCDVEKYDASTVGNAAV